MKSGEGSTGATISRYVSSRRRRSTKIIQLKRSVEQLEGQVAKSQAKTEQLQSGINALNADNAKLRHLSSILQNHLSRLHDEKILLTSIVDGLQADSLLGPSNSNLDPLHAVPDQRHFSSGGCESYLQDLIRPAACPVPENYAYGVPSSAYIPSSANTGTRRHHASLGPLTPGPTVLAQTVGRTPLYGLATASVLLPQGSRTAMPQYPASIGRQDHPSSQWTGSYMSTVPPDTQNIGSSVYAAHQVARGLGAAQHDLGLQAQATHIYDNGSLPASFEVQTQPLFDHESISSAEMLPILQSFPQLLIPDSYSPRSQKWPD